MATFSAEDDLDVVWPRVVEHVQSITKWDLNTASCLTPDEIVAKINPPKRDDGSSSRHTAKTVFARTLHCLQTFGQIAASAAGMVFGPSQQCMNAVSFVINATQRYSAVFDDLTTLMDRMSVFFDKLRVYLANASSETKLDRNLRPRVYEVLAHFLEVMARTHKLTNGHRGKVKLAFKVSIFGEDDGIRAALTKLETIIADVTNMEVTVIVNELSDAARNILNIDRKLYQVAEASEVTITKLGHLANAEERRSEAEAQKKEKERLRKALRITDGSQPWQEAHDELSRTRVAGTGQWFLNMVLVARWCNPSEPTLNAMVLRGSQNFGKSYLCSAVVDHLLEVHRNDSRVHVAYYYFHRGPADGEDSINKALKAVLWQFVQGDGQISRDFRKVAVKAIEQKADLSKTIEMWDTFVTNNISELQGTIFIVIDGINETDAEAPLVTFVSNVLASGNSGPGLQVRLLLAGRSDEMTSLNGDLEQPPTEINVSSSKHMAKRAPNHHDIELYTAARLDRMKQFNRSEFRGLKERIGDTLADGVKGDFYTLNSLLKEVEGARLPSQIEDILKRADDDRASIITRAVRRLNDELEPEEIRQANHILMWTLCGYGALLVEEMEAILGARDQLQSFVSLEQQITERYSALFLVEELDNDLYIKIVSHEIADLLDDVQPQGIDPAEIALVERVVKTHLDRTFGSDGEDLYAKYGFADFFQTKRLPPSTQIRYDPGTAHAHAAFECLSALVDELDNPKFRSFQVYAFDYFVEHLSTQKSQEAMDVQDRVLLRMICRKLLRLIYDPLLIQAWLPQWLDHRAAWFWNSAFIETIWDWSVEGLNERALEDMPGEKRWLKGLVDRKAQGVELLEKVAVAVAKEWYNVADRGLSLRWLRCFLSHRAGKSGEMFETTQEVIEETENWARQVLPDCVDPIQWDYCVGHTLDHYFHSEAALRRLELVPGSKKDMWKAAMKRSIVLADLGRWSDSVACLEQIVDTKRSDLDNDEALQAKFWETMLPSLSGGYVRLKRYDAAQVIISEILTHCYDTGFQQYAFDAVSDLLFIYETTGNHASATKFVLGLAERQEGDGNFLEALLLMGSSDLNSRILRAVIRAPKGLDIVLDSCEKASRTALSDESTLLWADLRMVVASILWRRALEDREGAYLILMGLVRSLPSFPYSLPFELLSSRTFAAAALGHLLLMDFKDAQRDIAARERILEQLEQLTRMDHMVVRHRQRDTRLPFGRALHLAGDHSKAREVLKGHLSLAMKDAQPTNPYDEQWQREAIFRIATVFAHLDDDENAKAAWSLLRMPFRRVEPVTSAVLSAEEDVRQEQCQQDPDGLENERDNHVAVEPEGPKHSNLDLKAVASEHLAQQYLGESKGLVKPSLRSQDAVASKVLFDNADGSEGNIVSLDDSNHNAGTPPLRDEKSHMTPLQTDGEDASDERDEIRGCCDGCDKEALYNDEFYQCRDCLDVLLCAECYSKHQAGELYRLLCMPTCLHLRMPALESQTEDRLGLDAPVMRRGEKIPLTQWLAEIRAEWGIKGTEFSARKKFKEVALKIRVGLKLDSEFAVKLEQAAYEKGLEMPQVDVIV